MEVYSKVHTLSLADVLNTLACFKPVEDDVLSFVSVLTGISEDKILEVIDEKNLPEPGYQAVIAERPVLTKERVISILQSYVNNDGEATVPGYVRDALEQAGCNEEEAKLLGFGWAWEDDE